MADARPDPPAQASVDSSLDPALDAAPDPLPGTDVDDYPDPDLEVASVLAKASTSFTRLHTPAKNYSPYRPATVITNLHRGNISTTTPSRLPEQYHPLHQMAALGELISLQQELQEGWDVNERDKLGLTPLIWACSGGNVPTLRLLLDRGADPLITGRDGQSALLTAASYGHADIVQILLEVGCEVNAMATDTGNTALMYAAHQNHARCAAVLLNYGADLTVENDAGNTAYDIAAKCNSLAVQGEIEKYMQKMLLASCTERNHAI